MARILINHVKRAVCAVYGVSGEDLDRHDRRARLVAPRQMAIAVARESTGASWAQLGKAFARNNGAVIHAARAVQSRVLGCTREQETFVEVTRLAHRYAEGDYAARPKFSRSLDLDLVPDDEIRSMKGLPAWTIAQRLSVPVSEVARVLEGA